MKKFMMTLAAVLCCAMTTTVLTACGGGDDSDTPGADTTPVAAKLVSEITVSDDLVKYMDVTVEYYDATGAIQKEQMTTTKWSKDVTAKLVAKLGARVTIKLKDGVDASKLDKITVSYSYAYAGACLNAAGQTVGSVTADQFEHSIVISGSDIEKFIENRKAGLIKFLYIFDGKSVTNGTWE